uniref:Ribosome biogenesis protein RPF2 homolog n=1 Tax=Strongyloides papillosus TaxID=174720 RepID=A0A0N5BCK8_STREA
MAGILPEGGHHVMEKTECLRNSKSNLQLITLNAQSFKNNLLEFTKALLTFNSHSILMLTENRNEKESLFLDNHYLYLIGTVDKHYRDDGVMIPIIYKNNLTSFQHIGLSRIAENLKRKRKDTT